MQTLKVKSRLVNHHQPINDPTAGAQAFLMDYPLALTSEIDCDGLTTCHVYSIPHS
jgi:hypothetical protein